ncbi:MAG: hypothetical protein RBR33_06965 [Sulfurovaceae bacterium]|nr:hypothetical protein [Sulfurovaceae bacterium]
MKHIILLAFNSIATILTMTLITLLIAANLYKKTISTIKDII